MTTIIIMTMIISIFLQYKLGCLSVYGGKKFLKQIVSSSDEGARDKVFSEVTLGIGHR